MLMSVHVGWTCSTFAHFILIRSITVYHGHVSERRNPGGNTWSPHRPTSVCRALAQCGNGWTERDRILPDLPGC